MPLRNLFIDFNSYFASVEQQVRPELRNKPVGVVPVMAETTCCIAASYEAKRFGVKTGTIVSEAKRLCPEIKLVEASHRTYVEFHERLVNTVETCIPVDKVLSIDEMVCSLYGNEQKRENAIAIAKNIKKTISKNVGEYLRCSIGIAPNHFLSKVGTDMQKPDGLVVIDLEDLPQCLYRMQVSDLYGIGRRMEVRLRRNNIYTVEDLYKADKTMMRKIWGGIEGERMYDKMRGKVVSHPLTHRSTVGHSHVLPPKLKNNESAYAVLHRLLQKAAMRMRYIGYYAGALGIIVRYSNPQRGSETLKSVPGYYSSDYRFVKKMKWKDYITFNYTQNTIELINAFNIMWNRNPNKELIPTAVGVVLFNLMHEKLATLPLFENYEKNKSLYKAVDLLNRRYGHTTVYFGGSHAAKYSAPMRIAFTQIPNLEIEDDGKKV